MTATITRPAWTIEFENETIDRLTLFCHFPSILNKRMKRKNSGR